MKYRIWPILALTFGTLVVLIAVSGIGALHSARQTYARISELHSRYRQSDRILNDVRSQIYLTELLTRDYLLDRSNLSAAYYRDQLMVARTGMLKEIDALRGVLRPEDDPKIQRLRDGLERYWDSLAPLFEWTPEEKTSFSTVFLRKHVLPRRQAALSMAREIRDLMQASLDAQRQQIDLKQGELPIYIVRMMVMTVLLGLLIASISIYRVRSLEQKSEAARERAEAAEHELRRLSQQLVHAHEAERRNISRELHDEVGQMLTALRVELRNLQELRNAAADSFDEHLEQTRHVAEQALRSVRDIAKGLRPSVLDDLGLGPAVQWQAREFSRRFGIPVTVQLEGSLTSLSDATRTCVYRIVQETLTNCARHAEAKDIRISILGMARAISVKVQDDGVGFDVARTRTQGLGLLGIEERVRELGGKLTIFSERRKGTTIAVDLPLEEAARA